MPRVDRYSPEEVTRCLCSSWRGGVIGPDCCGRIERVRPAGEIAYLSPDVLAAAGRLPYSFIVEETTPVAKRVDLLRRLVDQDMDDKELAKVSSECVAASDGTPRGIAQVLLDWQNTHIKYENDPGTLEVFQSPRYTLERSAGDCEDKSDFFVCLAKIAGLASGSCWVSQPRSKNNHVAARVCLTRLHGQTVPYSPAPWDYDEKRDSFDLEVTCPAQEFPGERYVWAEATLRGALIGEHPYAVLRRVRSTRQERASL